MSTAYIALFGFTAWTLLLVFAMEAFRTTVITLGRSRADAWPRGQVNPNEPAVMQRMHDAHQNCLESLPVFAAIVLLALGLDKLMAIETVAMFVLYLRIAQSTTHLIGTSHALVLVRGTLFSGQVVLFGYMLWALLS